jgi:predicted 3-demethylubiquinone-9 3-methyltransferase (glyoxalase superfamily)
MQKISPFLWFDTQAEEAARFYVSVFKNSSLGEITYYPDDIGGKPKGSVMTISFTLNGQTFTAMNASSPSSFSESVSFVVPCDTQEEVDTLWEALLAEGGEAMHCGWLRDKYGLAWQITPVVLLELIKNPAKCPNVMKAMMTMDKLDIAQLIEAAK